MRKHRAFVHGAGISALVLISIGAAHAQVPTPSRAPTPQVPTQLHNGVAAEPTVNQAMPRSAAVSIGGQPVEVMLSGALLTQVTAVQVIDAAGVLQPNIEAQISPGGRSSNALTVRVFGKKNARPGQYQLQLVVPADPRQVDTRPTNTPLGGGSTRALPVPASVASISVRAMEPKVASMTPVRPMTETLLVPQFIVSDVPGTEIISVNRASKVSEGNCDYHIDPRSGTQPAYVGGVQSATWTTPNTLEVLMLPGEFGPQSTCQIRFTIRTRNAFGEEFYSVVQPFMVSLTPAPPPVRLPVSSTWALRDYLYLPAGFQKGICDGTSVGAHGSVPVGKINVNGNLGFRARSGPIGSDCEWRVATHRLEAGWTLHMSFRVRRIGDKCRAGGTSAGGYDFSRLGSIIIQGDREVSLSSNLSSDPNALWLVDLRCDATLSNDHEVLVEMVSASVSRRNPPANCDWRCAFK